MVNISGDENVGEGGDGHLQRGGQAHLQNALEKIPMDGQLPRLHADAGVVLHQHEQHQHRRHALGNDGGQGHAPDAHVEVQHEKKVQHRVQHRGDDKEQERPAAVTHRAEDAGAHVVDQQAHDAGEVDGEVGRGLRHHLRRRVHQPQQRGGQAHADAGEGHAHDQRDDDGGVDGPGHLFLHFGAVVLTDDHTGAAAEPHEKADEHVDDGAHAAHGGEGLVGHEVAHHPGVHHIVELLEHVARQQGQGKQDQVPGDAARGHIHVVASAARRGLVQKESPTSAFFCICYLVYNIICHVATGDGDVLSYSGMYGAASYP